MALIAIPPPIRRTGIHLVAKNRTFSINLALSTSAPIRREWIGGLKRSVRIPSPNLEGQKKIDTGSATELVKLPERMGRSKIQMQVLVIIHLQGGGSQARI
ncbi:hypothetical protein, variant 2 [Blastomyces dermatitidis ER-3]|uniref:Uncharacterized protein n=1 Tax=Ajellomyces dermatitidis (strain ER-3 / ATCC MYA-2586) TaxID=559297 RepID=A0ABX2VYP5_AJEDR|nr:uncharacterized protein BDCG_17299 [Blastomyces dermatitidis ER-3]XP_045281666.1 hypothetical protein, variant 1 [Blastomyces dermatitidis ER-3]XP_045281667.1 hypothetical protein, variant 2 [Blastomyces dermatitidis ER-3]OAT01938.1 hypothetical protein BDCG_17299 [Blastomyces dermatitidis ER-3]OAT01939.1 hypothetical protein, variant 1 [Blastomyces dermatitidis ER-3]OAT01940.1 hypothetical protein, variant 2 [Blastomyces dermatitidis ER-3]